MTPMGVWPWGIQVGPFGVHKTYFCKVEFYFIHVSDAAFSFSCMHWKCQWRMNIVGDDWIGWLKQSRLKPIFFIVIWFQIISLWLAIGAPWNVGNQITNQIIMLKREVIGDCDLIVNQIIKTKDKILPLLRVYFRAIPHWAIAECWHIGYSPIMIRNCLEIYSENLRMHLSFVRSVSVMWNLNLIEWFDW